MTALPAPALLFLDKMGLSSQPPASPSLSLQQFILGQGAEHAASSASSGQVGPQMRGTFPYLLEQHKLIFSGRPPVDLLLVPAGGHSSLAHAFHREPLICPEKTPSEEQNARHRA